MQNLAHGIDLVDCPRIEQLLERHGDRFLARVFTEAERTYADANRNRIETLAGRFAAKEAVLKMIGTGWRGKIAWTDIEVINNPAGRPEAKLSGEVLDIAKSLGLGPISISISHTANFAMASAVALVGSDGQ